MHLSVSVNLFNGEELLIPALESLNTHVDHVSVVYQTVSYSGNPASEFLLPTLARAAECGLIDDVYQYRPDEFPADTPKQHEARKRTLGLQIAMARTATHFLSLDSDEFYRPAEFLRAKEKIAAEDFDVTVCRFRDYHSRSTYQYKELARYRGLDLYVPFICRIREGLVFDPTLDFFCVVDPSRKLPFTHPYVFPTEELLMHHMTTVRRDSASLVSKFLNAASRRVWAIESPSRLADLVWNFDPRQSRAPSVSIVEDEFGLASMRDESRGKSTEFAFSYLQGGQSK